MPGQKTTARMGRPSEIDRVVRNGDNGLPVTAGQQVIERMQLVNDLRVAAASAGVSNTALYHWRLDGARLRAIEAQGKRKLTDRERIFVDFVNALEKAEGEWEAGKVAIIQRAADGGYQHEKVTEVWKPGEDGTPKLVERTVVRWTADPQWTAAAWQLERRKPEKYGRRVALTDGEGGPLVKPDEQARGLADSLRDFLDREAQEEAVRVRAVKAKAIPARSAEVPSE